MFLLTALAWLLAAPPALAESRFFLFVTRDVPSQSLIDSAIGSAQAAGPPVPAETSRERLGRAFPQLFEAPSGERATIAAELQAGTAAHYATNFAQAEDHLARAFEIAYARPELLDQSADLVQKLSDAAALRYRNATAATKDVPEARRRFREFVRRFPHAEPTRTEHPPPVYALWEELKAEVLASAGPLMVHVQPLDLERSGSCRLLVNGAEIERMPLAGPIQLPTGPQSLQVVCGLQRSWLQRVDVRREPLTVRVPIRAMLAARAESRSGGLVLTRPEEGDASALVDAVSEAGGFDGAIVVQSASETVHIGRWERGATAPSIGYTGSFDADGISGVHLYDANGGADHTAAFVVGGVGAAALLGGIGLNLGYLAERGSSAPDQGTLDSLQTASIVMYGAGAALLVTGLVLYLVEDGSPSSSAGVSGGPGGVRVAF
ncbi:MAG: hypothetical protein EP329_14125 [Deltaproteobacteria bacterium]|nr:MAG: hypothetical protein EP329_14125 [Deltaproteobacteria bacterium]